MVTSPAERIAGPEIVENYRDFEPPGNITKLLHDLLDAVPQEHLVGLKNIVLTHHSALSRDQRRQKIWSRKRKIRLASARATYHQATRSSPSAIWLYVDNIMQSVPRVLWKLPLLRCVTLSDVLYHEIGHHIHAVHKPIYKDTEDVAEEWKRRLAARFLRRRYWYLVPLAYVFSPINWYRKWRKTRKAKN